MSSTPSFVEDSDGTLYYKKTIDRFLSKEEISLLTYLEHPNLVGYYHNDELDTNEIIFDYCEFGSFLELDVSKIALDAHDLWFIRNQILQALKYLASHELYHKGLNVSNVLVCSFYPIKVKLSLFSNSHVLIGHVNTEIPIQEFWKQKMNEQEEVCFDGLIQPIVKSVFPYSIIDNNIIFTNPNTLERNDLESLKALICSIESETMFKSDQCIGDFSSVNNNLSCVFKSFNSQERKNLFFSKTLFFHVLTQGILKFKKPLLEFDVDNSLFACKNKDFSSFTTKFISTSVNFRNVFFRAFDSACESRGHRLVIGSTRYHDSIISSLCFNTSQLSTSSVVYNNLLKKFPITSIITNTLNFNTGMIDTEKVTNLELKDFHDEDLTPITIFPNLSSFALYICEAVHDFNVLVLCRNLSSISLNRCSISDLTPFSNIEQLTSFSLSEVDVNDFSPLSTFKRLTKLSLSDCNFTDLSLLETLQQLKDLELLDYEITDISPLSSLENLRSLSLYINENGDLTPLSCLKSLKKLVLDDNNITDFSLLSSLENLVNLSLDYNRITDLTPLSSLFKLEKLSLNGTKVFDLWPLKNLTKLSILDLSSTLLPRERQRKLTNSSEIKQQINLFEHGVFNLDFSNSYGTIDLSLYSHCSKLKSLNLSNKRVEHMSDISKFTNLESLDLSNVKLPDDNKITDISFLSYCVKLESLSLDCSKVTDLSPLSLLVELESLSLKDTTVFDLWPLKNLTKLSTLDLKETLLPRDSQRKLTNSSTIKALINSFEHGVVDIYFSNYKDTINLSLYSHCSRLKSLNLLYKSVEDIVEISKFTNLESLDLSNVKLPGNNQITDISFLSSCIKLRSLSLCSSKVTDLGPLSHLSNSLQFLSLSNTLISDLSQLSSLKALEFLSLSNNNITDISPLSSLRNLTTLYLRKTKISNLRPLRNLTKLYSLDVRETLLPEEQQEEVFGLSNVQEFLHNFAVQPVSSTITHSHRKRTFTPVLSPKKVKK
ncbi:hypothetical protein RCL1_007633 [Eukaryota sp. TZLM3-RCL]